jgi:hypothetical protein
MKVMTEPGIVTLLGYGDGSSDEPILKVGFASQLGWCSAPTVNGDCTSPVFQHDLIVGFWTHGNGKFGRFEPVTEEIKDLLLPMEKLKTHVGVNFQSSHL